MQSVAGIKKNLHFNLVNYLRGILFEKKNTAIITAVKYICFRSKHRFRVLFSSMLIALRFA